MGCYAAALHRMQPLHRRIAGFGLHAAHAVARRAGIVGGPRVHRALVALGDRTIGGLARQPDATDAAAARWTAAAPAATRTDRPVVSVIGSLAPGGAERQLSIYLDEATRRGLARHVLVTLRPCEGVHAHYRPRLAARGIALHVAGGDRDDRVLERLVRDDALRSRLTAVPSGFRGDVLDLAGEFLRLEPRVVHAWLDHANVAAGIAALATGVPRVVLSLRSLHPGNFPVLHRAWMLPWYRAVLADPRVALVANSPEGADSYAGWLGIARERISVVTNAVDPAEMRRPTPGEVRAARAELGAGDGDVLVVGVMRLSEEKRPALFARLAVETCAAHPRARFALAGDGPLRDEVRAVAAPLGERFRMLGQRSDVARILAAADAVLLVSRVEGMPNVILEAQALGVPVVSTRVGGAGGAVEDGGTGFLCPADDVGAIAAALGRLVADGGLRARFGSRGPAFIAERFSVDAMVDATHAIYGFDGPRSEAAPG